MEVARDKQQTAGTLIRSGTEGELNGFCDVEKKAVAEELQEYITCSPVSLRLFSM